MRKDDTHQTIGALLLWLRKSSAFAALGFAISIFILQSSCQCMPMQSISPTPSRQAIQQSGVDREQLWVTSKVRVQSCNSPEDVVKAGWKRTHWLLGTEVEHG